MIMVYYSMTTSLKGIARVKAFYYTYRTVLQLGVIVHVYVSGTQATVFH